MKLSQKKRKIIRFVLIIFLVSFLSLFLYKNNKNIDYVVLCLGVVTVLVVFLWGGYGENYGSYNGSDDYDYEQENPNALVSGRLIAGTVYASNPNGTPGLGWVL